MAPIRGESLGTLYRTIVQEAEYSRRRDVRSERLGLIEQLGYVHRRKQVPPPGASGLGSLARSRRVPPPRASADVLADVRMWRERRRRSQFASTLADQLAAIQRLQIANEPVPQQLWLELDRAQRAPHLLPAVPTPGPGAYRGVAAPSAAPSASFGPAPDAARRAAEERREPPGPGPGQYVPPMAPFGATRGVAHRFDLGPARLVRDRSAYAPRSASAARAEDGLADAATIEEPPRPRTPAEDDDDDPFDTGSVGVRAGKESEIPNFKGSYLGRFPLVSADFWTSDHLSERSRSVDVFLRNARARNTHVEANLNLSSPAQVGVVAPEDRRRRRDGARAAANDDAASQASSHAPTVQSAATGGEASVPSVALLSFSTADDTTVSAHTNAFKSSGGATNLQPKKKPPPKKQERSSAWRPGSLRRNY